ncbi:hypothetical protein T265_11459 [Opisthorchis viverrini]|uniref:Uncharacterized protein n=1 Tax=Opisthorchis viverrini TaxID=6198 RepID=A0A074Z9F0_OPIVI|nr:hypothetical protein T265_11459 [Opisthorchis viverrini]KER19875.1 hypothetical protein T265_11459 [Opisthorchis viverrini]
MLLQKRNTAFLSSLPVALNSAAETIFDVYSPVSTVFPGHFLAGTDLRLCAVIPGDNFPKRAKELLVLYTALKY